MLPQRRPGKHQGSISHPNPGDAPARTRLWRRGGISIGTPARDQGSILRTYVIDQRRLKAVSAAGENKTWRHVAASPGRADVLELGGSNIANRLYSNFQHSAAGKRHACMHADRSLSMQRPAVSNAQRQLRGDIRATSCTVVIDQSREQTIDTMLIKRGQWQRLGVVVIAFGHCSSIAAISSLRSTMALRTDWSWIPVSYEGISPLSSTSSGSRSHGLLSRPCEACSCPCLFR